MEPNLVCSEQVPQKSESQSVLESWTETSGCALEVERSTCHPESAQVELRRSVVLCARVCLFLGSFGGFSFLSSHVCCVPSLSHHLKPARVSRTCNFVGFVFDLRTDMVQDQQQIGCAKKCTHLHLDHFCTVVCCDGSHCVPVFFLISILASLH